MRTDTGIDVRQGDRVAFRVTGQIQWGSGPDSSSGADGNAVMMKPDFPVPSVPVGAFIGRVGNGPGFGIGNQTQPLSMPASGRLFVGVNDTTSTTTADPSRCLHHKVARRRPIYGDAISCLRVGSLGGVDAVRQRHRPVEPTQPAEHRDPSKLPRRLRERLHPESRAEMP